MVKVVTDVSVLITGGTGFVGSNVVRRLAENGREVVCFGRSADEPDQLRNWYFDDISENVQLYAGDVLERQSIKEAIEQFDVTQIVHTATITPSAEREREQAETILGVNILGTSNVLDIARDSDVNRVVYTSSGAVYRANSELAPIDEYDSLHLNGLYPISKYSSEQLCQYYSNRYELDAVTARLGWIYGPMERPVSSRAGMSEVFNSMTAALDGRTLKVNDLNRYRDWTHSQDVARGIQLLLESNNLGEDVYNLTSGTAYTIHELLECIDSVLGPITVEQVASPSDATVPVNSKNRRGPLSIDRLTRATDFEPTYSLKEGLNEYQQWLKAARANAVL